VFTASILDGSSLFPVESRPTNGDRLVSVAFYWDPSRRADSFCRRQRNRDFSEAVKLIILIVITLSARMHYQSIRHGTKTPGKAAITRLT
jgi:hypothetical protein